MPFTVDAVPHLPAGFGDTFTSRTVDVDGVGLHAVVGGTGPALLLLPAWPQFWYGWRLVMPALAEHFTVVAADMRGMGASSKSAGGYDAVTLADEMTGLMDSLGHDSFHVAGYDMGMMVGYVLAARHRDRVTRLVLAEAVLAGFTPMPPLLMPPEVNELAWHFVFNRLADINERMVSGREEIYFGYQFATKAASPEAIPQTAVDVYVDALRDPAALHASFEFYRAGESGDQVVALAAEGPLDIPVLAIGGEYGMRDGVEQAVRQVASDTSGAIAPGAAHFLPEEAPEWTARTLIDFFA
ncbi:alpha/beta fold hydrolase [Streptomyces olivaceus]|uniref:alpha/beta fold hydrolase n=1 Tax=Streptomyces olivaceus TaxID=47716 RepID=UPI00380472B2